MTVLEAIVAAVVGNAAALAILGWLTKSLVGTWLSKDLERHKAQLSAENASASERLRHELSLIAQHRQIVFSKLHEKRAEAISKTYELLTDAARLGSIYVSPIDYAGDPEKPEKFQSFATAYNEFSNYFEKSRIYLPEATCSLIEKLLDEMRQPAIKMNVYMRHEQVQDNRVQRERLDAWSSAWKAFQEDVPAAKKALELDLRTLLGDNLAV